MFTSKTNNTTDNEKQSKSVTYYNLIILDKSGSMESIRKATINGVNSTLQTIRQFAEENPDTRQSVSLATFCGCGITPVWYNMSIEKIEGLSPAQYQPCCMTPLYDAIGECCTRLVMETLADNDARYSVTIITDGLENASKKWSHARVTKLINDLKERGWLFSYIGTDHDVERVAKSIAIDNAIDFEKSDEGTDEVFAYENNARMEWMAKVKIAKDEEMMSLNKGFFKKR